MKVIRPNCRLQFTAEDIEFILSVLHPRVDSQQALVRLLTDEETRDLILDDERLLHAVLENRTCLRISTHFYFYILVRQVFRRSGLEDRAVADYVAEVLSEFCHTEALRQRAQPGGPPMEYLVDMLAALQNADDFTRFYVHAHMGNTSLFLSGIFPDRIRLRAERRGAPGISYYEGIGRTSYREAGDHRLAQHYDLANVFDQLAERFQETRLALNDLRDRLVTLGDNDAAIEAMLAASAKMWS